MLKSARVSVPTPKEERGGNEKCEEPKSNASSQEVLVIILTPCGRHQNGASVTAAAAVRIQSSAKSHRDVESLDTCTRTTESCGFSLSSTQQSSGSLALETKTQGVPVWASFSARESTFWSRPCRDKSSSGSSLYGNTGFEEKSVSLCVINRLRRKHTRLYSMKCTHSM